MSNPPNKSVLLRTREAYDLWSDNYDHLDNPMFAMVEYAFHLNPPRLNGKRVVELGCGTGRNIERVISSGAKTYLGLDQSSGMLERAQKKYPLFQFVNSDITQTLPFKNESFDYVLVTLVFEHLLHLAPTLTEAFRILAPKGELRILEIHSELTSQGTGAHFQHEDKEVVLPSYPHDYNQWSLVLKQAGFAKLKIEELTANSEAVLRCSKLAKHLGKAVLFDICAYKDG